MSQKIENWVINMKKEHIVVIALIILFVGISLAWIVNSQLREKRWVSVVMFRGEDYTQNNNYRLTTGNFTISGEEWRIRWQCQRLGNGSYLEIMVLDADNDSFVKDIVPRYYLEDVSYLEGPGRFYLKIGVVGQVNWTIYIEEYK